MRHAALSLILALAPEGAVCTNSGEVNPESLRAAQGGKASEEPCPPLEVCADLDRHRFLCTVAAPAACDPFLERFEQLMSLCDCSASDGRAGCTMPKLYACGEVATKGTNVFDASLATLAELARSKSERALRLFASQKFRDMLSGESVDSYYDDSVNADRVLRGLLPRPPYQEPTLSVRASSTLRRQGANRYDPELVLDGREDTAWCEGARGDGVGEWIEMRARHLSGWKTPLCQVLIVPGYAKSPAAYRQNGQVTRVRISSCAHPEARVESGIEPFQVNLPYPRVIIPSGALKGEADCFRLTILEVARGRVPDTCISELRPVYCDPNSAGAGSPAAEPR